MYLDKSQNIQKALKKDLLNLLKRLKFAESKYNKGLKSECIKYKEFLENDVFGFDVKLCSMSDMPL